MTIEKITLNVHDYESAKNALWSIINFLKGQSHIIIPSMTYIAEDNDHDHIHISIVKQNLNGVDKEQAHADYLKDLLEYEDANKSQPITPQESN